VKEVTGNKKCDASIFYSPSHCLNNPINKKLGCPNVEMKIDK
jgi:hypothetical protein